MDFLCNEYIFCYLPFKASDTTHPHSEMQKALKNEKNFCKFGAKVDLKQTTYVVFVFVVVQLLNRVRLFRDPHGL